MSHFVVDTEANGPCPGLYSMIQIGVILIDEEGLKNTFFAEFYPIGLKWDDNAIKAIGLTRSEIEKYPPADKGILDLYNWIAATNKNGRPIMWSDNPAFDWQWVNYYFHLFIGKNPFGFSARRIGDVYCGIVKDTYASWKHLRKTKHDHFPVNDAKGNAEALLHMKHQMNLKISF